MAHRQAHVYTQGFGQKNQPVRIPRREIDSETRIVQPLTADYIRREKNG